MTPQEFNEKEFELLQLVPLEFRAALSGLAYERGHAYGYEEVLGHLQNYVDTLVEPIEQFKLRLKGDGNAKY